uniref:MARVEL domain-containing protein n=1 Tax=Panagrolaimus sp. PS1159 TaxID=55785 RepID=A0AC35FMU4_9BILA
MSNIYAGLRFTCSITKGIILAIILFGIFHGDSHDIITAACVIVCVSLLFLIVLHIINGFEGIRSNTPAIIDVILLGIVLVLTIPELGLVGAAAWNQYVLVRCETMYEPAFVCDVVCFFAAIALICCHVFISQTQ